MQQRADPDFYLSLFLFTADLNLADGAARRRLVQRLQAIAALGYGGVELPIAATDLVDPQQELAWHRQLRDELEASGCGALAVSTNVAATARFDPTAADAAVRAGALAYLRSRVEITAALGGTLMMGPLVFPYGTWPRQHLDGPPLWSDDLQAHLPAALERATPVLRQAADHAADLGVRLAIEPITHWEMPAFNTLAQLMPWLAQVNHPQLGVVIDSAHELLDGAGPQEFASQVAALAAAGRLHYLQLSAPDRGRLDRCWLPWQPFLEAVLPHYDGPLAIEIFNALPEFQPLFHLTRPLYPLEPASAGAVPDALEVARLALQVSRREVQTALGRTGQLWQDGPAANEG